MRIRSVKPEYWRSPDTAELDYFTRLMYIGLWNYVDDNGVGEDNVALIRSDLFPRDDVDETSRLIHGALRDLSLRAHITRYEHLPSGRRYLHVTNWHHQKINRPTQSTKPLPTSENTRLIEPSVSAHGGLTEGSLLDQGNKGARDRGIKDPPTPQRDEPAPAARGGTRDGTGKALERVRELNLTARSIDAYSIAEAFSASLTIPIESTLLAKIGVEIDKCLKSNIPPPAIAQGLKAWTASNSWSTTQIPQFVHKANYRPTGGKSTAKAQGYDDALAELLQEVKTL